MKKLIIVAAAMLLVCATSFAQLNVNLGYAQSTDRYKAGNNLYSMRLNGFTVGLGYRCRPGQSARQCDRALCPCPHDAEL